MNAEVPFHKTKAIRDKKQSQILLLQLMETHQCGLVVVYCVRKLSEGPAPGQIVPITAWCHEINNGNGKGAAVDIPHGLSKIFLVRG